MRLLEARDGVRRSSAPLTIFVPHASNVLTNHRADGDGLVAFEVISRLAARGHRVHVASPRIEVVGAVPPGLVLHPLGRARRAGDLAYAIEVRRLYERLARDVRFDLVHQLNPVNTGMSLALLGVRAPVVLGAFVDDWPDVRPRTLSSRLSRTFKRAVSTLQQRLATRIFVTTPATLAHRITTAPSVRARVRLIPHGIEPSDFDGARSSALDPVVVFLGGIEIRKGILTLLRAFDRVAERNPSARLVIAGAGHLNRSVTQYVARSPAGDRIEFLGRVEREHVVDLLRRAAVYCMPSFGEPFGMSLLEAMAAAKPVVVTDLGGPAFITDDVGAIRVPIGDETRLAEALDALLADPERRACMGAHNRRIVEERFAWSTVIDRIEDLYREAIAERGRTAP